MKPTVGRIVHVYSVEGTVQSGPFAGIVVGRSSAGLGIKVLNPVDGFKDDVRLFDPEEGFVYRPRRAPTGKGWLWVWPPRES